MTDYCCINVGTNDTDALIKAVKEYFSSDGQKAAEAKLKTAFDGIMNGLFSNLIHKEAILGEFKDSHYIMLIAEDPFMCEALAEAISKSLSAKVIFSRFDEYSTSFLIYRNGNITVKFLNDFDLGKSLFIDENAKLSETQLDALNKLNNEISSGSVDIDLVIDTEYAFDAAFATNYSQMRDKTIRDEWIANGAEIYTVKI